MVLPKKTNLFDNFLSRNEFKLEPTLTKSITELTESPMDERAITDKNNSKKNRSKGQCEVVTPGAWDSIDCGNEICPAEKCSLDHMLAGNNFISFDGSEVKGECIEVRIQNGFQNVSNEMSLSAFQ